MLLKFEPGLAAWAIVTFLFLFGLLYYLVWPKLLAFLEERENHIRGSLEEAEKARREAERITAEYRNMISRAKTESVEIIRQAQEQSEKVREQLIAHAKTDAKSIVDKTIHELELEREKAVAELKTRAVNLSVAIAAKIITSSLTLEQQARLAHQALKEMESAQ